MLKNSYNKLFTEFKNRIFWGTLSRGGGGVTKITSQVRYPTGKSNCDWPLNINYSYFLYFVQSQSPMNLPFSVRQSVQLYIVHPFLFIRMTRVCPSWSVQKLHVEEEPVHTHTYLFVGPAKPRSYRFAVVSKSHSVSL